MAISSSLQSRNLTLTLSRPPRIQETSTRSPLSFCTSPPLRSCSLRSARVTVSHNRVQGGIAEEDAQPSALDHASEIEKESPGESWRPPENRRWLSWEGLPQRYKLIGATSLAFVVCNMDKVNLSIAIIPMSHQFGWNASTAGLVQSSFFWGYALSQLPGDSFAKFFGGREVLEIGVCAWSMATALVPVVSGFLPGLVLSRILVGIGEGVSPSAATDIIARSIPPDERSRAVGLVFGGLSIGSVAGLLLAPPFIQSLGWESVLYAFGFLGLIWESMTYSRDHLIDLGDKMRKNQQNRLYWKKSGC